MYRTALARRHRPRHFSELIGQDHVSRTLRAAVEEGRAAHAYLFCGPRGIGKTTAARVLAMALNCEARSAGEPCGTCESCERIWAGRTAVDVVEIDAASHRGVDDARDLRERAMYAPSDEDRHKIYIVDEAHMLTREAWNALLKILEEPPPRVIFVFATTEPQKIRQTAAPVLSRVQRFDFRRVTVPELVERLREVLALEGVEAEEGALLPIARRADGGVRDALSMLDQVLSFSGSEVRTEDVRRLLGLVEEERYLELFARVAERDRASVFPFVQGLLDDGYDLAEFARGLGEALRVLLALRLDPEADTAELAPESRTAFREAADRFSVEELLRMLAAAAEFEASGRLRRSSQPRIQVEMLLLRLASVDAIVGLDELLGLLEGGSEPTRARRTPPRAAPRSPRGRSEPAPAASRPGPVEADGPPSRARPKADPPPEPAAQPATGQAADRAAEPAGGAGAGSLHEAWRGALEAVRGRSLRGAAIGLRGATIQGLDGSTVRLEVPGGLVTDLDEFLGDPARSDGLRRELGARLGLEPADLVFELNAGDGPRRMTAEAARDQKLRRWMETDPRLRQAVETLDLELKE
ncbi:MAG: DNA polymerase III subunit gamma/tau [Gemmatimonadota bacterium]|nr:DNA polymerase III subunit gamma/tau [Gemmatimonadota bacterium]